MSTSHALKRAYNKIAGPAFDLSRKSKYLKRTRRYDLGKMALGRASWTRRSVGRPQYSLRDSWKPNRVVYTATSIMPAEYINRMKYSEDWVDTTGGGVVDYVYHMNNVYDPYAAAGGQQCNGWSVMNALYAKHKVIYSSIKATVVNNDVDDPLTLTIVPNAASGALTNVYDNSKPEAKSIVVSNQAGQGVLTHGMSPRRLAGAQYNDYNLVCSTTAAPATPYYWHVILRNVSGNALSSFIKVDIDYITLWFDRIMTTT